jgi:hypothetical protein
MTRSTIFLSLIFVTAGTCLPSRGLAIKGGIHFTEPLPSNDKRITHTHTNCREGFKKYAVEMGSVAMIYIPNFTKINSGIPKFMRDIETTWRSHKVG